MLLPNVVSKKKKKNKNVNTSFLWSDQIRDTEKRSQKSKTLNYSGSVDSLWVCALEGTGADVFRVSPSGGVFVVFVVFFFFCVVSRRKREWKRPQDRDDDSCRERERIKWKDPKWEAIPDTLKKKRVEKRVER